MPTHDRLESFFSDYKRLTETEKDLFKHAVGQFVDDLRTGQFRKGLRVKKMSGHVGIWEMTWADDGRATFAYGEELTGRPGPHIIWRRVGTQSIFKQP